MLSVSLVPNRDWLASGDTQAKARSASAAPQARNRVRSRAPRPESCRAPTEGLVDPGFHKVRLGMMLSTLNGLGLI